MRAPRILSFALCLALTLLGPGALAQTEDEIASVNAQAALLDDVWAEAILRQAIAATGCMVPLELVAAFETFLIVEGMAGLGVAIDRETALDASFAARFDQQIDDHPFGAALVAVATATRSVYIAAMRDGRLRMDHMVYRTEGCEPTGTVFVLRDFARP